jgi:hypothetical protein
VNLFHQKKPNQLLRSMSIKFILVIKMVTTTSFYNIDFKSQCLMCIGYASFYSLLKNAPRQFLERKHNWKFEFLCWAFHYEGAAKAVSRRPPSHTRKKVRAMWDPPQK